MFAMRIPPRPGRLPRPFGPQRMITGKQHRPSQPQRERGIGGSANGLVHSTDRFFSIRVGEEAARPISDRPGDRWLRW